MEFLESFLVIFLSGIVARSVGMLFFKGTDKEAKKNADSEYVIVKNSPIFIVVGILELAIGIGMVKLAEKGILIGSASDKVFLVLFFVIMGLSFIVYGLALKIVVDKTTDYIVFRSINRIKQTIYYNDIDYYIERKNGNIDFFVNGKKYQVYQFAYNFDALIREFGQRHVKKIHRNQLSADGTLKNKNDQNNQRDG